MDEHLFVQPYNRLITDLVLQGIKPDHIQVVGYIQVTMIITAPFFQIFFPSVTIGLILGMPKDQILHMSLLSQSTRIPYRTVMIFIRMKNFSLAV